MICTPSDVAAQLVLQRRKAALRVHVPLVDAKTEFDGVRRRARAVSGNVGYAIARLWLRSPFAVFVIAVRKLSRSPWAYLRSGLTDFSPAARVRCALGAAAAGSARRLLSGT